MPTPIKLLRIKWCQYCDYYPLLGMFLQFLVFFCLFGENYADDKKIEECSVQIGDKARPTISPENCHDFDSTTCNALFPKDEQTHRDNPDVYVK